MARPQSESVFVFDCLRLPPSSSLWCVFSCKGAATSLIPKVSVIVFASLRLCPFPSSAVFVHFRLRLSPSLSISVFGCLRLCPFPSSTVSVFVHFRLRLSPS